jgi:hypothetical protein
MHNVQDNVRQKYLELVKKYHPDTADTASVEKFQKIDEVSFTFQCSHWRPVTIEAFLLAEHIFSRCSAMAS